MADPYDGEQGLAKLERALGIYMGGGLPERVATVRDEIVRRVSMWEGMGIADLGREHDAIDAVFRVIDKVDVCAVVNGGLIPTDIWWGMLAHGLDEPGLVRRVRDQIHRETMALVARDHLNEVRAEGGKKSAKHTGEKLRARNQAIRDAYNEMTKPKRDRAAILANRFGVSASQIRRIIANK